MLCPVTIGHHIVNYRLLATYTIYIQPPQIQAITNLGPSAPRLDWALPISLTITTLLILVLAIGLVTVSPQDWSPILHLFVGTPTQTRDHSLPAA